MIKEAAEMLTWQVQQIRRSRCEYRVPRVFSNFDRLSALTGGEFLLLPIRPYYPEDADITFVGNPLRFDWGLMGDGYIGE
jgi:hypothetical protein